MIRRIVEGVAVSGVVGLWIVYGYYGDLDPCQILSHERSGLLQGVFAESPQSMTSLECAGQLPGEWLSAAQDFWSDRPAN